MKIAYAGSDGRTLVSALTTSNSAKNREHRGVVMRGMPAMKPFAELMKWPVDFVEVLGEAPTVADYVQAAIKALREEKIDRIVPMPEALQFDGFVDQMIEEGFGEFVAGLTREGSMLEGDKIGCMEFCRKYGVAVPKAWDVVDLRDFVAFRRRCLEYLGHFGGFYAKFPYSAGGKGSRFIQSPWDIAPVYQGLMDDYSKVYEKRVNPEKLWPILLQSYMAGIEVSFTLLVDVHGNFQILPTGEDGQGRFPGPITINNPVTGGMWSVSPHPMESPELLELARRDIFEPFIKGMRKAGILRSCILYPGCMVFFDAFGKPQSIRMCEMNVRPPDPEFQPMVWRIKNFGALIQAMFKGNLGQVVPEIREDQIAMTLAAVTGPGPDSSYKGYPWRHKPGEPMEINHAALAKNGITLIPAGMGYKDGGFISDGTRVAYLLAAAQVKPGKTRGETADDLRAKLLRLFEAGAVRTIPQGEGEDRKGNRLVVRGDVGEHFGAAEKLFGK